MVLQMLFLCSVFGSINTLNILNVYKPAIKATEYMSNGLESEEKSYFKHSDR